MLERPTRCLNPLRHCSLNSSKPIQSRRMLHVAFWWHGAEDLDLPQWYYTMQALFEPSKSQTTPSGSSTCGKKSSFFPSALRTPYLDFLYPDETKALIRRLSTLKYRQIHQIFRNRVADNESRQIVSEARRLQSTHVIEQSLSSEEVEDVSASAELEKTATSLIEPAELLDRYIADQREGTRVLNWTEFYRLFSALDPASQTVRLRRDVIQVLSVSPRIVDAKRVVRLFAETDVADRDQSVYRCAIRAFSKLNELENATFVHDEAMARLRDELGDVNSVGSLDLLATTVSAQNWQAAMHIWNSRGCPATLLDSNSDWGVPFYDVMQRIPELGEKILSCISMTAEYPAILAEGKGFLLNLVKCLLYYGEATPSQTLKIISKTRELGLFELTPLACYSILTRESLSAHGRLKYALKLFDFCEKDKVTPKKKVYHALLHTSIKAHDPSVAPRVQSAWSKFYGSLPVSIVSLLMQAYAQRGDVDKVEQILSEFKKSKGKVTLQLYSHILHAYAVRSDPNRVRDRMAALKEDTGLDPNIECWNILLNAYSRDADLDGATACFSNIVESGLVPNSYTICTLMYPAAQRGDIQYVEQVQEYARTHAIEHSEIMDSCSVLAYLKNDQLEAASSTAERLTNKERPETATRMWNQILTYCALHRSSKKLDSMERAFRAMTQLGVPPDESTYSAIMRAYIVNGQLDIARKILAGLEKHPSLTPFAFHYAVLISGYSDLEQFQDGLRIYARMLDRHVRPSLSTQLALMMLNLRAARNKHLRDNTQHPGIRLDLPEELIEETIQSMEENALAEQNPQLLSSRFTPSEYFPTAMFEQLFTFYSRSGSYDLIKTLLERYQNVTSDGTTSRWQYPLRLLAIMMQISKQQNAVEEFEKYWELAKQLAYKTLTTNLGPGRPFIPVQKRKLLAAHFDVYLEYLDKQDRSGQLLHAINDYQGMGFTLDNSNWIRWVTIMLRRERYIDAFTICERDLIGNFHGWSEGGRNARRKKLKLSAPHGERPQSFLSRAFFATEKTFVRFAKAMVQLERSAPFSRQRRETLNHVVSKAPRTVEAIRKMPIFDDRWMKGKLGLEEWTRLRRPYMRRVAGAKRLRRNEREREASRRMAAEAASYQDWATTVFDYNDRAKHNTPAE